MVELTNEIISKWRNKIQKDLKLEIIAVYEQAEIDEKEKDVLVIEDVKVELEKVKVDGKNSK